MAAFPPREREAFMAHWARILGEETVMVRTVTVDGKVAGNVLSFDRLGEREVGYWIGREHWGKGVATAALSAFLLQERTRPLTARVATINAGSIRVLEKCGFVAVDPDAEDPDPLGDGIQETVLRRFGDAEGPRTLRAMTGRLQGAIAASITPMKDGGRAIDSDAIGALSAFLAAGGVDGVLACGTTGEGVLLSVDERRTVTESFLHARSVGFKVAVHAGAQTTAETVALAAHALEVDADAVAVIGPPYFPLDGDELFRHFVSAANACDPVPFYLYEFVARSGYAIPLDVVARVRQAAPNVVGLKVSDVPFDAVKPYLGLGMDVFIGQEPLALEGLEAGAVGSVSGLASAFPGVVADLIHGRSAIAHDAVALMRARLRGIPFHAALKEILVMRDVLLRADVRAPLRGLTQDEVGVVTALVHEIDAR